MEEKVKRPTKKQHRLLIFIENFVAEKGYGPSYREIMNGCGYSSVATVAAHVNNLVTNGLLTKKDRSARSLEVANPSTIKPKKIQTNSVLESQEKWLVELIDYKFSQAESSQLEKNDIDELYVLVGALKVLGFESAAQSFMPRLSVLKK